MAAKATETKTTGTPISEVLDTFMKAIANESEESRAAKMALLPEFLSVLNMLCNGPGPFISQGSDDACAYPSHSNY